MTGSRLVRDYVHGEPGLESFYGGSFRDPGAYAARAEALDRAFGASGRREAAKLLEGSGVDPERLAAFVEEEGFLMSAGQQPGLFGGPLYSVYKGLSAIVAAEALEEALGRPVLPVFWIASEDHDWDEARSLHVLDPRNELHEVSLPVDGEARNRPLFRVPLDGGVQETLERFLALHPDTDFSPAFAEVLQEGFRPGRTLVEGFRHFMETLLGPMGLVFVEAHEPELKNRSLPVLIRELHAAQRSEDELRRTAESLEERGYPVQVPILEGGVNLFVEGPAGRERLYRDGAGLFHLRHSRHPLSEEEIADRVREDPSVVSPNVLLRPVVENALFPVLGHVAGPGEIGYYAQLRPLFERHELAMPVILPRHSVTILEGKVLKVLDKFDLKLDDLSRPHHELAGTLLREEIPESTRRALGELRGGIARGTGALVNEVESIDRTLTRTAEQVRTQAFQLLDDVEKKIVQSLKRENEVTLSQVEKAQRHVFPSGKPQERTLNPVYYLSRYGEEFLERLLQAFREAPPGPRREDV